MTLRLIKKNRSKAKLNSYLPIITVNRSNKNISAQIVDPESGKSLFGMNSSKLKNSKQEKSSQVGASIAAKLKELKIDRVQFNRNGYLYHGRIKAVADSIRTAGINI